MTPDPPPAAATSESADAPSPERPPVRIHVILVEPEIAGNTGAVGRSCVAAGAGLWLVRPLGFHLDHRRIRRAGLDYWEHLTYTIVDSLDEALERIGTGRAWYFSGKASRVYTSVEYRVGDALVFGSESRGLPERLLAERAAHAVRIPIRPEARSLNLGNAASIGLFEAVRRIDAADSLAPGAGSDRSDPLGP